MRNLILAVIVSTASFSIFAETGKVKTVNSGDTLSIEIEGKTANYRLYGIDAPEEGQAFSLEAKQFLIEKLLNKEVEVEIITKDKKEVPVAKLIIPDAGELNLQLVKKGFAWWDSENVPEHFEYQAALAEAITSKAGLWSSGVPLAPWDYRKSNDIESVPYLKEVVAEAPAPREEMKEDETKVLKAKGNEVYRGNFIDAGNFDPKEAENFDLNTALMKFKPRPATGADGKAIGFTADNISQLPYASQLGLRDGDIVSSVNGISLTGGIPQIMGLINQHKNNPPKSISVDILRGGKTETINVNLP